MNNMLNKKISHGRLRGDKKSTAGTNSKVKKNVIGGERLRGSKKSTAGTNSQKGKIILPDYLKFLKSNVEGDLHHWLSKGNYGALDVFVVNIHPDLHTRIHHGDLGVQGFIESEGFDCLVISSMELLYMYINSMRGLSENDELFAELVIFCEKVIEDPSSAIEIAKERSPFIMGSV